MFSQIIDRLTYGVQKPNRDSRKIFVEEVITKLPYDIVRG